MLELDGSFGEGGGQILRSSLALSLLTGKPFHLRNVRAGRAKPGLQPQHLMSVRAAATVGSATTAGASLQSTDLVFEPGPVKAGNYRFAIGTAGATGLVLHTIYLPLALRGGEPSTIVFEGGTHNLASPCYHFLERTWQPYLAQIGLNLSLTMRRAGFYPRGGGLVEANIAPCERLHGLKLVERTSLTSAGGFSAVAGLPEDIARRQARRAVSRLKQRALKEVGIEQENWSGGPGTVLAVELPTEPVPTLFFGLGARGKRAEAVADEAVDQVLAYLASSGAVDPHSADQLVLPLALAAGPSEFTVSEVTAHLTTNIAVIRRFIDRDIAIEGVEGQPGRVRM